jgi:hypothetical protein
MANMIKYSMSDIPPGFVKAFWDTKNDRQGGGPYISYREWLQLQGAYFSVAGSIGSNTDIILNFNNPEDELIFRLKWGI